MTPVNIAFKRFAFLVMLADFMDVITSIVVSSTGIYSIPVRYIFNTLDCALTTLSAYAFIYYIYAYSNIKKASMIRRKWIIRVLLFIYFGIILTNPLTGLVFSYDKDASYIHETLFIPIAYGFPILFFAIGSFYMLTHRQKFKKSQTRIMVLAIINTGNS